MPFGMQTPSAGDFADIVNRRQRRSHVQNRLRSCHKGENPGRYHTMPAPKFAVDFGSIEVGYGRFCRTGPIIMWSPKDSRYPRSP